MNKVKKQIWAYLSVKKGMYDNDYYFYEDGTILHHYDRTMKKLDIEEYISPSNIPDEEKEKMLKKCRAECPDTIVFEIGKILNYES